MSCSVVVVTPTFDYGKHLRSIRQAASCGQQLIGGGSESSLSSMESQSSVSTVETLTLSCHTPSQTVATSIQSQTTTQFETSSISTMTLSPSQTPHTLSDSRSRSNRSLHQILPPSNASSSSSTPYIHAPVYSNATLYGELANAVSAISMAAQFVAGGVRCVCSKVKRKLSWPLALKRLRDNKVTQASSSEETHDIGLLKCKKCARVSAKERQNSTMTI